jgi:hypothetical protein
MNETRRFMTQNNNDLTLHPLNGFAAPVGDAVAGLEIAALEGLKRLRRGLGDGHLVALAARVAEERVKRELGGAQRLGFDA